MKTKIEERKNIIVSLSSNYFGERDKGIDTRIKYLRTMGILNLVLAILCGGIIVLSILNEFFGFEIFKWNKMGLLTILSISFILNLPNELYELKLLKHLKNINTKSEFNGIDELNTELKNVIDNLNNRLKNNWILIALGIVIMIMGIWQMFYDKNNPYWNYMKLPILMFYGINVIRFVFTNKKLTKNINETEKILDLAIT